IERGSSSFRRLSFRRLVLRYDGGDVVGVAPRIAPTRQAGDLESLDAVRVHDEVDKTRDFGEAVAGEAALGDRAAVYVGAPGPSHPSLGGKGVRPDGGDLEFGRRGGLGLEESCGCGQN